MRHRLAADLPFRSGQTSMSGYANGRCGWDLREGEEVQEMAADRATPQVLEGYSARLLAYRDAVSIVPVALRLVLVAVTVYDPEAAVDPNVPRYIPIPSVRTA